jgi:hypothetical protein
MRGGASPLLGTGYQVRVHLALVLALLLIYPALVFLRGPWLRHRRRRRGRCVQCGYSLRGNFTGICPECGETTMNTRAKETWLNRRSGAPRQAGWTRCVEVQR